MKNLPLDRDFVIVGECISRPKGVRRVVMDTVCRLTGHLLWRARTVIFPIDRSIPVSGSYCRRCYRYGYVQGDYRD